MTKDNPVDKKYTGLRNVTALGIVSFFTDFSTEMILGNLPLYLMSEFGVSRAIVGAVEGSAELTGYALRIIPGSISDKMGRRKIFVVIGYSISTITKPFFAVATNWMEILAARAADRVGKATREAPRDALISDSVHESISGKAFGIHRSIDQLGAIAGPMAAFALLEVTDIHSVFLFSIIPGIIAVLVVVFFVKEIAIKTPSKNAIIANMGNLIKNNTPFLFLLIISGLFGLGAFNFSFILLRASELGVDKNVIPLVYATINIAYVFVGIPSGILADKIGKENVMIIGFAMFVVSTMAMFVLAGNSLFAYILAAIFGTYLGISQTMQRAILPKYVASEMRGTAFGLYNLVIGITFFIGNVVFGFLWDDFSLKTAISYSLILVITAIVGMILFTKRFGKISLNH